MALSASGDRLPASALERVEGHTIDPARLSGSDERRPVLKRDAVVPPVVGGVPGCPGDGHHGIPAAECFEEFVGRHGCIVTDDLSCCNSFSGVLAPEKVSTITGMSELSPKDVGKRLRALMLDPELALDTVDDFARLLGAERSAASAWVNGYNFPRVPSMARLMEHYPGLTLDWIYLGIPDAVPVKVFIRLQALLERVPFPLVQEEPGEGLPAKARKRRAVRKKATGHK